MSIPTRHVFGAALPLMLVATAAGSDLRAIAEWQKAPDLCERRLLVQKLQHEDVRVRSAALDLLEEVTGRDFGLDPWLLPADVPQEVQKALAEWAALDEMLGADAAPPSAEQVRESVALLRSADPDTRRRICLRFARWQAPLAVALQKELSADAPLTEQERDHLRCALFRLQLQESLGNDVEHVAGALTSHARNDILTGLEALRKAGKSALPVLMTFVDSTDGLLREVAVDVLLQTGGDAAFEILMPRLMEESDRNILQIAARRAPDCSPLPQIVAFLNQCACSQDEDVAVAALEALGDMSEDEDDSSELKAKLAGAAHAMPVATYRELLQRPFWRVRAAALGALKLKASFKPSVEGTELQQAVLDALQDDDETVRARAMQVLHAHKLAAQYFEQLVQYALRTPSEAAYVVYLACSSRNAALPSALADVVSRFSPEQLEQLMYYDDEFSTVFEQTSEHSAAAREVIQALMANPDPRVKRRLMTEWGSSLFWAAPEWNVSVSDWLCNPSVDDMLKAEVLENLPDRKPSKLREAVSDVSLCDWLENELVGSAAHKPELQRLMYLVLVQLRPDRINELPNEYLSMLTPKELNSLLSNTPELLRRIPKEQANVFLRGCESGTFRMIVSELGENVAFLLELDLSDDQWMYLAENEVQYRSSSSNEMGPVMLRSLDDVAHPVRRQLAAFLLQSISPNSEADVLTNMLEELPEPQREAFRCLKEAPLTANDVEEWARRYAESPHAALRLAVAGCLLPERDWKFYLPVTIGNSTTLFSVNSPAHNLMRYPKRVSCPVSLIRLVQSLQQDSDPAVALIACGSLLYRTGDCDRARMSELLVRLAQLRKELEDKPDAALSREIKSLCSSLEGVWKRWHKYRSDTVEFFKLKGSPKKLRPGVDKLLVELAEAIDDYPWGVLDEVKSMMPSYSGSMSSHKDNPARPHEFNFPSQPVNESSPAPAAEPDVTAAEPVVEVEDEPEEPVVPAIDKTAPLRVEFFHQEGCDICRKVELKLRELRREFPGMELVNYDVKSPEGQERNAVLCARFDVPPRERRKAPVIFAEAGYLTGEQAASDQAEKLLLESLTVAESARRLVKSETAQADSAAAIPDKPSPVEGASAPSAEEPRGEQTGKLSAATAEEKTAAASEQVWALLRSYGMLGIGAFVALFGLCMLLFGRGGRNSQEH